MKSGNSNIFSFLGLQNHCGQCDCSHEIIKCLLLGRKVMTNQDSIKSRETTLQTKVYLSQSYGFSSSQVWMWELNHKESWAPRNGCFCTVVREKTLESPLDHKEIQPVNSKGDQSQKFIGRADVEAEAPIFWATWCEQPIHWKSPWCWERLRAGAEGGDRGWDGWMASPTQQMWVWACSGSWWWPAKPDVLQSMGSQRVGYGCVTELNWLRSYGVSKLGKSLSKRIKSQVLSHIFSSVKYSPNEDNWNNCFDLNIYP